MVCELDEFEMLPSVGALQKVPLGKPLAEQVLAMRRVRRQEPIEAKESSSVLRLVSQP